MISDETPKKRLTSLPVNPFDLLVYMVSLLAIHVLL